MPKKIDPAAEGAGGADGRGARQDYPSVTALAAGGGQAARSGRETVRRWVVQAEVDAGARPGMTSTEQAEIKRLKAENRRLREDNEILKAATVFFAGELDSRNR